MLGWGRSSGGTRFSGETGKFATADCLTVSSMRLVLGVSELGGFVLCCKPGRRQHRHSVLLLLGHVEWEFVTEARFHACMLE